MINNFISKSMEAFMAGNGRIGCIVNELFKDYIELYRHMVNQLSLSSARLVPTIIANIIKGK
jgi:hypothetical protein